MSFSNDDLIAFIVRRIVDTVQPEKEIFSAVKPGVMPGRIATLICL